MLQDRRRADINFRHHHSDGDLINRQRIRPKWGVGAEARTAVGNEGGKASTQAPEDVHVQGPQSGIYRISSEVKGGQKIIIYIWSTQQGTTLSRNMCKGRFN